MNNEVTRITQIQNLKGKTIHIALKTKSADRCVNLLQLGFTDGTECAFVADDPQVDINLVDDSEHIIPERQLRLKNVGKIN